MKSHKMRLNVQVSNGEQGMFPKGKQMGPDDPQFDSLLAQGFLEPLEGAVVNVQVPADPGPPPPADPGADAKPPAQPPQDPPAVDAGASNEKAQADQKPQSKPKGN